jgi:branched-chain amino acid transport system substrate-binding protein
MRALWTGTFLCCICMSGIASAQSARIAVAGPMSGPQEKSGRALVVGAIEAAKAIGSVAGKQLEIVTVDDQGNPAAARSAADSRVLKENISFVIGHTSSSTSFAAWAAYGPAGVLQVLPRGFAGFQGQGGKVNPIRLCNDETERGAVLAEYLMRQLGVRQFGVVHGESDFERVAAEQLNVALVSAGLKSVGLDKSNPAGFRNSVGGLESKGAEAVILSTLVADASGLYQAQQQFQKVRVVIDWQTAQSLAAGQQLQRGASAPLVLQEIDQTGGRQIPKEIGDLRASGPIAVNNAMLGFAAVQVIAEGIRRAGSPDPGGVAARLQGSAVTTLLGDLKFTNNGDAQVPRYAVYGFGQGNFRPDGTDVTCDKGGCTCKDGGCSKNCCKN